MPHSPLRRAGAVLLGGNFLLLVLKAFATWKTGSLAVLSETVDSLCDMLASGVALLCVVIGSRGADADHPFGHSRAEPLGALVVAMFTGIVAFQVIRGAIERMLEGPAQVRFVSLAVGTLIVTALLKTAMAVHLGRTGRAIDSPGLRAGATDCRNDVVVAVAALAGVVGNHFGALWLDPAAAIVVALYVLASGFEIARENIDYLMGKSPDPSRVEEIRQAACTVPGVRAVDLVRAHHIGPKVHVELIVRVEGTLLTTESHDVGVAVQHAVERLPSVERAFVHIEPWQTAADPAAAAPPLPGGHV